MQHECCECVERLKAENERLSKPQTCESLGYHICGSDNTEGKLRKALGWVRRNVRHTNWEYVIVMIDKALKDSK